jgi:hypothetical protein
VLAAVGQDGWALQYASPKFQNDKEVVLKAVGKSGGSLQYASEELKNDKEVVLEAVGQDGWALQYASDTLKNDRDVVLEAVGQDGKLIIYASKKLQEDKGVRFAAFRSNLYNFYFEDRKFDPVAGLVIAGGIISSAALIALGVVRQFFFKEIDPKTLYDLTLGLGIGAGVVGAGSVVVGGVNQTYKAYKTSGREEQSFIKSLLEESLRPLSKTIS